MAEKATRKPLSKFFRAFFVPTSPATPKAEPERRIARRFVAAFFLVVRTDGVAATVAHFIPFEILDPIGTP